MATFHRPSQVLQRSATTAIRVDLRSQSSLRSGGKERGRDILKKKPNETEKKARASLALGSAIHRREENMEAVDT
jgi:hypothetical protein